MRWNKNILIATLAGGIVFFGALALITAWHRGKEAKAQIEFYKAGADLNGLTQLLQHYPQSRATAFARMALGEKEAQGKNFDACVKEYEKLYENGGRVVLFRVLALHKMAACQEGKGNLREACALYARAAKEPGHLTPWFSRYEETRCFAAAKDPSAKEHFLSLLQEKNLPPDLREQVEEQYLWFQLQKSL